MEMENQVQQQNEVNVETQPQVQDEPKMVQMTQEQLDKLISDRLARQERKLNEQFDKRLNELSEAQKLQAMSEEERKEHDYAKRLEELVNREKAIQERENAYNKQQYKAEIQRQLNEAGLPDISDTLTHLGAEEVKSHIDVMKASFDAQVNASIENRIKQSASVPTTPIKESKPLTLEDINNMTPQEIKAHKSEVEKVLLNSFRK